MRITDETGLATVGHGGNFIYFHTEMIIHPESGIGVFMSTNTASGIPLPTALARMIMNAAIYEKTGVEHAAVPLPDSEPIELSRAELERLTGFYLGLGNVTISDEGILHVANVPGLPMSLEFTPLADGSFMTLMGRFWFGEIEGRAVMFQGDHKLAVGERFDNRWQADDSFERWLGEYFYYPEVEGSSIDVLTGSLSVGIDDEGYAYLSMMGMPFPIDMIDDNTFYLLGTGRNLGTVIHLNEDSEGIWLSFFGARFLKGSAE